MRKGKFRSWQGFPRLTLNLTGPVHCRSAPVGVEAEDSHSGYGLVPELDRDGGNWAKTFEI